VGIRTRRHPIVSPPLSHSYSEPSTSSFGISIGLWAAAAAIYWLVGSATSVILLARGQHSSNLLACGGITYLLAYELDRRQKGMLHFIISTHQKMKNHDPEGYRLCHGSAVLEIEQL